MSSSFGITQSSSEASLREARVCGTREIRVNVRERERETDCYDTQSTNCGESWHHTKKNKFYI